MHSVSIESLWPFLGFVAAVIHLSGILSAFHAIVRTRTAQGAVAWAISLVTFPYLALPLYWIFGRGKFYGYVAARRSGDLKIHHIAADLRDRLKRPDTRFQTPEGCSLRVLERLAGMPFTSGNEIEVLQDGSAAYGAMFDAIDAAQRYVLLQSYLIRDDDLGRDLKARLLRTARRGIAVHLLYDEIGSYGLPANFGAELIAGGVKVRAFSTVRGPVNRFQLNFRNHRKSLVVDGSRAFVGGLNYGDEYLGRSGPFGAWRDTHVRLSGPAVQAVQLAFVEDWYWAAREVPELLWDPRPGSGGAAALVLPTGPADHWDSCELFLLEVIRTAKTRIWIASPYFVPDEQIVSALQLASLRGVEVRILLPLQADHVLMDWASYAYYPMAERAGIEIYRYEAGFLHQKVLLVDDTLASIGTANLDNRSFRLNFEISTVVWDRRFAGLVETMLRDDFSASRKVVAGELDDKSVWFRFGVRFSRLFAPIL